jgi:[ribosomal protein S5]-alanine N-acetyltransferase
MRVILETPRLQLRTLGESDIDTMLQELNNFAITRNTARVPYPYNRDDAVEFLQFVEELNERSMVAAISRKSSPELLLGVISYEWSETKQDAELGYWLSETIWGNGFGTEAAQATVDHAFTINGHAKLVACFHDDNPASGRILSKLGFEAIGACSNFSKAQQRNVSVTTMQLLKINWENQKAAP